jgi:hypothetical protein
MKGLLFLGILLVVLLVASIGLSKEQKEGFVDPGSTASLKAPQIIIPKVNPKPAPLEGTTPAPYLDVTELAYGPAYGDIARVNTLPYRDPSLESASYKRLAELLESLKGFFTYEAKSLEKLSDPQVQLPLTTARGDLQRLTDEVNVLKRNPGLDSALTQGQADEIQANLAYLQRKFRLSVNSASGSTPLEGFEDLTESDERLTLDEVKEIKVRIEAEVTRLSASGTTDPVTTNRINSLNSIKSNIESLITEVESGARPTSQIPITEKDRDSFLPLMSQVDKPLPALLDAAKLPLSVSNVFPSYDSGDNSGAKAAQLLFEQYGEKLFNGLSWSLGLKFTSPNEVAVATSKGPGADKSDDPLFLTAGSGINNQRDPATGKVISFPRGEFESVTGGADLERLEVRPTLDIGKTAKYDWKDKAARICDAIRKNGMDPKEFGCIDPSDQVGTDYSWRGNARMVCTRLLTTPDPGLPEQCGCPPIEWPGWKS